MVCPVPALDNPSVNRTTTPPICHLPLGPTVCGTRQGPQARTPAELSHLPWLLTTDSLQPSLHTYQWVESMAIFIIYTFCWTPRLQRRSSECCLCNYSHILRYIQTTT